MADNQNHSFSSGRIRRAAPQPPQQPPAQNLFDDAQPPPSQNGRGSVFDYDDGAPTKGARSSGYSETYLSGAPRQSAAPTGVFDYEQGAPAPRNARRSMQEQHFNVETQPRQASQPRQAAPSRQARAQSAAPPPPPPRGNVFDALDGPDDGDDRSRGGRGDGYPPKAKQGRVKKPKAKGSRKRKVLVILAVILALGITGVLAASLYAGQLLDPGAFGRIVSNLDVPRAYSKKDVIHLLIIGIDYEEGREYRDGLGLTDMILYCRYDIKNNKLNMLQIPRDSYVGESLATGGTGKINALLISGEDRDAPINNLAGPFQTLFQLPVDNYVAMDMEALKVIVDTFGGIRVFVPKTMDYGGSHLDEGWQWLDGNAAEFFVRNRKGEGFNRGDIDRLDNQRHFYSALFRRFLNLTPKDVKNLLPVFDHYCNTDLSLNDMIGLGVAALNLKAEDVLFAKVPGATGDGLDPTGANRSLYIVDKYGRGTEEDPGLAALLNQYFRGEEEADVSADSMGLPDIQIPSGYALYPPNIQGMAEVQGPEGGSDVAVEPGAA